MESSQYDSADAIVRALTSFHFNVFFLKEGLIYLASASHHLQPKMSFLTRWFWNNNHL